MNSLCSTGQASEVWIDPLAGLVFRLNLFDGHLLVRLRGDFGGWGVGSTIAWGAVASVGHRWFLERLDVTLELSYRALAADYTSNSDDFGVDLALHGPAVAAIFSF